MNGFISFFVITLFISNGVSAAECNSDLKPTDSYKELSDALKCINNRIQAIEQKSANVQGSVRTSLNEPVEIKGCVTSSSLATTSHFFLRGGAKFCRDDGFVWLRISPDVLTPDQSNYVGMQFPEAGRQTTCTPSQASCVAEDKASGQKFSLTVEPGSAPDGKSVWIGIFQRVTK